MSLLLEKSVETSLLFEKPSLTAETQVDTTPGQFPHLPSKPWKFTMFTLL
jgi:hypothetical protein